MTAWAGLRATREQSREVLRREHLANLKKGVLTDFENEVQRFWGNVFTGGALRFRATDGRSGPDPPTEFLFRHLLGDEIGCHFADLSDAIQKMNESYAKFANELHEKAKTIAAKWQPANGEDERWRDAMVAYLFERVLISGHDATALSPSFLTTGEERRSILNKLITLKSGSNIDCWAQLEIDKLRPTFKSCQKQFALAQQAVSLKGRCGLVG